MNRLKKTLAALTALTCLCSATVLPVSAADNIDFPSMEVIEDYVGYPAEYGGGMEDRTVSTMPYFLVETDGTLLADADVKHLAGFSSVEVSDIDEDMANCYAGLEYQSDARYYEVHLDSMEHMVTAARTFQMENDFVQNVYFLRKDSRTPIYGPWGIVVYPKDENAVFSVKDFPRLNSMTKNKEDAGWGVSLSLELQDEHDAVCETDYEDYLFMCEQGELLMEEHGDVFDHFELAYCGRVAVYSYFYLTQSPWSTAGDPNSDGAVTAEDAADLLISAAASGTGAAVKATAASDVNADGTVSADDAAAVLVYAAANGSGNPMSWVEVLRK